MTDGCNHLAEIVKKNSYKNRFEASYKKSKFIYVIWGKIDFLQKLKLA